MAMQACHGASYSDVDTIGSYTNTAFELEMFTQLPVYHQYTGHAINKQAGTRATRTHHGEGEPVVVMIYERMTSLPIPISQDLSIWDLDVVVVQQDTLWFSSHRSRPVPLPGRYCRPSCVVPSAAPTETERGEADNEWQEKWWWNKHFGLARGGALPLQTR